MEQDQSAAMCKLLNKPYKWCSSLESLKLQIGHFLLYCFTGNGCKTAVTRMSFNPLGKVSARSHIHPALRYLHQSIWACSEQSQDRQHDSCCSFNVLCLMFAPHCYMPASSTAYLLQLCTNTGLNSLCTHLPPINICLAFCCHATSHCSSGTAIASSYRVEMIISCRLSN